MFRFQPEKIARANGVQAANSLVIKPEISGATRLMLIAPHPDDEALACGIILQGAVRAGAAIRVLYATAGENNPWPQRALERKWRLGSRDRGRWGRLRRIEARAALQVLGIGRSNAQFFGLPDQGLTDLLMRGCQSTLYLFQKTITSWHPTLLLVPSISDTHADHNALGVILRVMQSELARVPRLSVWSYNVHGRCAVFSRHAITLGQSRSETVTKRSAIGCHKTQITLSRKRFLAYATRPEKFRKLTPCAPAGADGPIRFSTRDVHILRLSLRLSFRPFPAAKPRLILLGRSQSSNAHKCVTMPLPARSSEVVMIDHGTKRSAGIMSYRGNAFFGEATIPLTIFSSAKALFVKIDRGGLLSRDRWVEIGAAVALTSVARARRNSDRRFGQNDHDEHQARC